MNSEITTRDELNIGQIANQAASQGIFADYLLRKAANTIRSHRSALQLLITYLTPDIDELVAAKLAIEMQQGQHWGNITWGMVEQFKLWMLSEGYAIGTVNQRLAAIRSYAILAERAGIIPSDEGRKIQLSKGYSHKEGRKVDEKRTTQRVGQKKATATAITEEQAKILKAQPATPQGCRDQLIMCLLLDHGLRVGEVARLKVENFNLDTGILLFERPKVSKDQKHKLSSDTMRTAYQWLYKGYAPNTGPILRGSRKNGQLTEPGMSEAAIRERVSALGKAAGIKTLSPHDCRHYWATYWAGKVDVLRLQEAGGWNSLAMPRRYVQEKEVANEGMV